MKPQITPSLKLKNFSQINNALYIDFKTTAEATTIQIVQKQSAHILKIVARVALQQFKIIIGLTNGNIL